MKGNLGIVSVHHIKLNEKFLQREKMAEEATVKQGDIEKTGGNGKKKKLPVHCFPWWMSQLTCKEATREKETRTKNGDNTKEQSRRNEKEDSFWR